MNCTNSSFFKNGPKIKVYNDTNVQKGVTWMARRSRWDMVESKNAFLSPGSSLSYRFKYKPGYKGDTFLEVMVADEQGKRQSCLVSTSGVISIRNILNGTCNMGVGYNSTLTPSWLY